MFELVVAVGKNCEESKTLKRGTYAEICEETINYESTNEIRNEYQQQINEFWENKTDIKNDKIVVIEPISPGYNIRHRVIYKSDKALFDKLLKNPGKSDPSYEAWLKFWDCLKGKILIEKENSTSNQNNNIQEKYRNFNNCKQHFAEMLSEFPNLYQLIKTDHDKYYELAEIVLKAFENYIKIYRYLGKDVNSIFGKYLNLRNNKKHQVKRNFVLEKNNQITGYFEFEDFEIYDELGDYDNKDQDYIHSKTYLYLKPYIERKDREYLIKFLEDNQLNDLTPQELDEIRLVISSAISEDIDELNSDFDDLELFDELGNYGDNIPDYIHSNEYLLLKPYIETKDIEFLKRYLEAYLPSNLTQDELDEINNIINSHKKIR